MKRKRFRKVSLRLALFVLMPLCAIGFFVGSRVMHANRQMQIMQSLEDQSITNQWTGVFYSDDAVWWQAFWGDNPALMVDYAVITGTPEQLKAIEPLVNLKWLSLDHPPGDLTAQRMRHVIKTHPKLVGFDVQGSPSKEVWQEISRTPKLTELIVSHGNNFDDEVLGYFVDRPLTELTLPECPQLTDEGLRLISKISTLKALNIEAAKVADQALSTLGSLPSLESLSLRKTRLRGTGFAGFGDRSRLKYLNLSHCPLDAEAYQYIAKLGWLQTLFLHGTSITDQQLGQLTQLSELHTLSLGGTPITDDAAKQLVKFPSLQTLSLDYTPLTDQAIGRLAALKKLRSLSCRNTYVSPTALNRLGDSVTHDRNDGGLTISWDGVACVDTRSGEVVGYLPAFPESLSNKSAVAWSSEFDALTVFALQSGMPIRFLRDDYPLTDISADGSQLITMDQGRCVIYEFPSQRKRELFLGYQSQASSIRLVGRQLFGIDPNVNCWSMESGRMLWKGGPELPAAGVVVAYENRLAVFNPQQVAVMTALDDNVEFVSHQLSVDPNSVGLRQIHSVGFRDDGAVIVAQLGGSDESLEIRDLKADKTIVSIPVSPQAALLSKDATIVATFKLRRGDIQIWDAATGTLMATVRVEHRNEEMMFTPDGRYLVVGVKDIVMEYR